MELSKEEIGSKQAQALYAFAGWLTTRKEETLFSAKHNCAPIAELIKRFCDSQDWKITEDDVRGVYNLKDYPKE